MEPSQQDLRLVEPPSAEALMPNTLGWEAWCAIGGGLLVLALIAFFVWRHFNRPAFIDPASLRKKAHDEAVAAFAVCPTDAPTPAATECSLILRRFLVAITGDPALYETHDEWVARHDAVESLSGELKQETQSLFSQLAQWKYAPDAAGEEPSTMIERSRHLVEAINREFAA